MDTIRKCLISIDMGQNQENKAWILGNKELIELGLYILVKKAYHISKDLKQFYKNQIQSGQFLFLDKENTDEQGNN